LKLTHSKERVRACTPDRNMIRTMAGRACCKTGKTGTNGVRCGGEHEEEGKRGGRKSVLKKGEPLSAQSRLLLAVSGFFAAGNALSGTFVNVYLWKAKQDFTLIGWFTLIHHLTMALTFWISGKWVKEHNKMNCLRAGVAVSALFYLIVLWFGESAAEYFVLLA
ncbi:hypothetical protein ABFY68_27955, partial [Paenibacillus validus]